MSGPKLFRLPSNGRMMSHQMTNTHLFLEDADSGDSAHWYKLVMQMLLLVSVGTPLLQMLEQPLIDRPIGPMIEAAFDMLFTIELVARLIVSPAPRVFFCKPFNVIDLVSPATLIFRLIDCLDFGLVDTPDVFLLCLTPALRLIKMLRRWETMHLLTKAFTDVLEALPVLLFPLVVLMLTFAALLFMVEPRDNVPSLPWAMWLTIVTMTTVGYGDVVPESTYGSLLISVLVISSVMYMAMPVAILSGSFEKVWQERDAEMLVHRTRLRLAQWGYTASDIPSLFRTFDRHRNGELNAATFSRMIKTMKLGLTEEQIKCLVQVFDADGNGSIDEKEFLGVLFPSRYGDGASEGYSVDVEQEDGMSGRRSLETS